MACPVVHSAAPMVPLLATVPLPARPVVDSRLTAAVGDVARPRRAPLPGPGLGHLPGESGRLRGIANLVDFMRRGADHVADQRRRFGSVFRAPVGGSLAVWVCDPEMVAKIARNGDQAWSAALAWTALFEGIDSSNETLDFLGTLDFEPHREARRLLQPAFGPAATAGYLDEARPLFEPPVDGWIAQGRVAFKPEVRRLLADVSSRIFVGDDEDGPMLDRALADTWSAPLVLVKNRWLSLGWRRATRGHRQLREALRARIPQRRSRGGEDLFSRLCCMPRDIEWLDDDAMVRLFIGVMLGAFDTTAAGLASMAYLLGRHPTWQDRVREGALALGEGPIGYEDIRRLETADCAWKETLRLFPITSNLPRYTLRDVEIGGHRIPAGTLVLASIGPAQRDAAWWKYPDRFDPDRFAPGRAEDRKQPFMPFGAGAHACIGTHLASAEVKAFWYTMVTRCRFRLARDYQAHHTYTPMGSVSGDVGLVVERL